MNVFPPIVSVPMRADPLFALIVNDAVPGPEPDPPPVTVIQETLATVVQAHPVAAVTDADPDPPLSLIESDAGEIVGAQGAPASMTVKVWPAIVIVPLRPLVEGFALALNAVVPAPLPDAPDVTVSHPLLLAAVQAQPAGALTSTDPVPPEKGTGCEVAEIVNVQEMPVCVTLNV